MDKGYIAVIGAVNIDIWGRSSSVLILRDSNPGVISYSMGGVGRNIAHNLSLMGEKVSMLTALGDDHWSERVEQSCRLLGIDLSRALRVPGGRTGTYLCISGPDGDMAIGLSDMEIAGHISPEMVEKELSFLDKANLVVVDGNLREDTIKYVCENVKAPIFADPVSVTKAKKFLPYLRYIHSFKPNSLEAETLTAESVPEDAAFALVRKGVKRAFVSDGSGGMVVAEEGNVFRVPILPCRLVNASGGGDAVMAALAHAYCMGFSAEESARFAMAAGAIAVESAETISPHMSHKALEERYEHKA